MKKVVLLGRPNVGKSSLFNVLIRRKKAITSSIENTTRDVKYEEVSQGGQTYLLCDMGGLTDGKGLFLDLVNKRVHSEIQKADLMIALFDIKDIQSADREIITLISRYKKESLVVLNKADNQNEDSSYTDFYKLGIKDYVMISCQSLFNIHILRKKIVDKLDSMEEKIEVLEDEDNVSLEKNPTTEEGLIKISLLGRPNVGKSSLINVLLGEERAIVSEISGTTRDVVDGFFLFKGKKIQVMDTAGIRKKGRKKEEIEELSLKKSLRMIGESDVVVVVIDAKDNISKQDKKIVQVCQNRSKPLLFLINKWDISPYSWKEYEKYLHCEFPMIKEQVLLPISTKTKRGVDAFQKEILRLYTVSHEKISRRALERCIDEALLRHTPKRVNGKQLKIKQAIQFYQNPVGIKLWVNSKSLMDKSYLRYLEGSIKKQFNLSGINVKMVVVERNKKS